jgi:hypothetical protein
VAEVVPEVRPSAALFYLLLSDDGWHATDRWILVGSVALFVAVALSQAAALAGGDKGLASAVGTLTACAYFLMFAMVLVSNAP